MQLKKIKRKCDVRGCKNTQNVFLLSQRREFGNTVAICRDCLEKALAQADNYIEEKKVKREPEPLFPHPELAVTISSVAVDEEEPKPQEVIDEVAEDNPVSVTEDTVTIEKNTGNPVVHDVDKVKKPVTTSSKPKSNNKSTKKR